MDITFTEKSHKVVIGDHVRAWDFPPMISRDDRYVEGIVNDMTGDIITIHILKDTLYPIGARFTVRTPLNTFFTEYEERIQILGHYDPNTNKYTATEQKPFVIQGEFDSEKITKVADRSTEFFSEKTPDPVNGGWDKGNNEEYAKEQFDENFDSFITGCCNIIKDHYDRWYTNLTPPVILKKVNKKYIRVSRKDSQESVHCFIDKTTGDVFKAASWSAPAKHARGNIFDKNNGLGMMGPHGPASLR